jgi:hypothetical protein
MIGLSFNGNRRSMSTPTRLFSGVSRDAIGLSRANYWQGLLGSKMAILGPQATSELSPQTVE